MSCFFEILLPVALDQSFTYKGSSQDFAVGDVVKVPFGRKNIWGLILHKKPKLDENSAISFDKIKEITQKHKFLHFDKNLIEFIEKIASYNLAPKGMVLKAFLGVINSDKIKSEKLTDKFLEQKIDFSKIQLKKLSQKQQEIADEILKSKKNVSLVDAVTGSGKTEIYFSIIAKILKNNHESQVLIMLPEIALTSQLLTRFETQFGFKPAIWHSKISTKEKREIFHGIANGGVKVLIGARSSLLLPFKNLQLIVIDEEHDQSFKQDEVFNFNARDMAVLKSSIENFHVILSSATPSLESYYNAHEGLKYNYFCLEDKFNNKKNDIKIIDMRQQKLEKGCHISEVLRSEMVKNLENNHQTLLFLNRRGYAPVMLCKACGQKVNCLNCSSYLVYHKHNKTATCHYCGHFEKFENDCKSCKEKDTIITIGAGVEKIKEEVESLFPKARIAMITSDNVANFKQVQEIVDKISRNEIDVIIGTQIIAKGYDFENLTLVGVIDADASSFGGDLKSLEKTFQLLSQVTGRAGRKHLGGRVFIQTYNPQNLVFEKIVENDKKGFYEFELKNRKNLNLPPFSKMAKITVNSFDSKKSLNFAKNIAKTVPFCNTVEVFGPAPAAIERIKNKFYYNLHLKVDKKINMHKLILGVIKMLDNKKSQVKVKVDIDP